MPAIYPSLISADLLNLATVIRTLDPWCAGYHIDIMDNHFVPNLTWGADMTNAIARATTKKIWVHLMIQNPDSLISRLVVPAGSIVSIHMENKIDKIKTISQIKEKNWSPSIAIGPKTALSEIFPLTHLIDQVLIMSVEPGFAGQQFIPSTIDRLHHLVNHRTAAGQSFKIAVDGGITARHVQSLLAGGADELAVASAVFATGDPVENLRHLNALCEQK